VLIEGRRHKAMADQMGTVSKKRLHKRIGSVSEEDMHGVEQAILFQLGSILTPQVSIRKSNRSTEFVNGLPEPIQPDEPEQQHRISLCPGLLSFMATWRHGRGPREHFPGSEPHQSWPPSRAGILAEPNSKDPRGK
jgi:hypothetical protein